jgi:hypothetical protein
VLKEGIAIIVRQLPQRKRFELVIGWAFSRDLHIDPFSFILMVRSSYIMMNVGV